MDFITGFLILANLKGDSYDLILVIIDQLIKMVYYEPIKVMINTPDLAEIIINMIVCYHRVSKSIIIDWSLLFISKLWFLLCYFLEIKKSYLQPFIPK